MSAQVKLTDEELSQVMVFLDEKPSGSEEELHKMWFHNALARYYLYIEKDVNKALKLTEKNIDNIHSLFTQNFSEDDREKKSILFILALNIVRLSFYQNDIAICKLQIQELRASIFQKTLIKEGIFPEDLTALLNQYGAILIKDMTEEDFDYYRLKLTIMESKLIDNLLESFYQHVKDRPLEIAFIDHDKKQSYSWENLSKIASGISGLIPKNAKYVLICSEQSILYTASIVASWESNVIPVMTHENYTVHELEQIKINFKNDEVAVLIDEKHDSKITQKYKTVFGSIILLNEKSGHPKQNNIQKENLALGLLTSGSSGPPKLCLFSHESLIQAARIEAANEPVYQKGLVANLRPHYTSAGLNSLWPSLLLGATTVVSEKIRKTPIPRFLNEFIEKYDLSLLILSPTYIISLFQNEEVELHSKYKLPLYFGGSSLPWNMVTKLIQHNFLPAMRYGMTEVAHIISKVNFTLDQKSYDKPNVGVPFKNVRVKIQDHHLEIYSPGLVSKIVDQGRESNVCDNRYTSLDRAEFNSEGAILLEGRDNRTININGFRFNSQQVEEVLNSSPAIVDCRVLGIKNENEEQKLCAFILVQTSDCKIDVLEKELRNLAIEKLSHFKQPTSYIFLNEWPMSVNGKIDFNKLKSLV